VTARELLLILNSVPPDTEIVLHRPGAKVQVPYTTDVTVFAGYFVKDDPKDNAGLFVHEQHAMAVQEDGRPLLDLVSKNIHSAVLLERSR